MRKKVVRALSTAAVIGGLLVATTAPALAVASDSGELKIRGAQALSLDAFAINEILAKPEAGVREVQIRGVSVDPLQIDVANIAAGLREAKIEGTNLAGRPFEIKVKNGVARQEFGDAMKNGGKGRVGTSRTINNSHARDRGQDLDHSLRGRERAEQERERRGRVEVERHRRPGHNGRVEQRFRVTEPRNRAVITTARGRTEFVGSRGKPEGFVSSGHGVRGDSGRSLTAVADRSDHDQSGSHSRHEGGRGK